MNIKEEIKEEIKKEIKEINIEELADELMIEMNNDIKHKLNKEIIEKSIIEMITTNMDKEKIEMITTNMDKEIEEKSIIEIITTNMDKEPELESITEITKNKYELDQDTMQRFSVIIQFILEMYRVITSSLLILFVPQLCNDHICTISENLVFETNIYNTALCFNFISMFVLVIMYYLELVRENRLIKYLNVNSDIANDNETVGQRIQLLSLTKQNKIFVINKYYKYVFYIVIIVYVLNIFLSLSIVINFYAGSQTISTFITYILFMASKLNSVYGIISTKKNICFSAYMKTNVQYNDIDNDYKIII